MRRKSNFWALWGALLLDWLYCKVHIFIYILFFWMLYRCTTWITTKELGRKLDGTYTRQLRAALNVKWQSHTINQIIYGIFTRLQPPYDEADWNSMDTVDVARMRLWAKCWCGNQLTGNDPGGVLRRHLLTNWLKTHD